MESMESNSPTKEAGEVRNKSQGAETAGDVRGCKPVANHHQSHSQPPSPNSPILENAIEELTKQSKSKSLDLVFCGWLTMMLAFLHLYTSAKDIGWLEASVLAATTAGKGTGLARSLWEWVWEYLEDNTQLPSSLYERHNRS